MPQATGQLHGLARPQLRGNLAVLRRSTTTPFSSLPTPRAISASSHRSAGLLQLLEVGPRDGLQNIAVQVPTPVKIELIQRLADTGIKHIEATSFVSPEWVPQLADGAEVMQSILPLAREKSIELQVLAPSMKGLENALAAGATQVTVFASATEAFSKANQNCTVDQALDAADQVAKKALSHGLNVRGTLSCIFSDPYSGPTDPKEVVRVAKRFHDMGCYQIGLGDTLGVGTAAVANVMASYDMGIRIFDAAVAGLGGCPYARGAKGNLSTEDIVYAFENSGIITGVDLAQLSAT
ncbi:unnamed protein product [Zymoseptoria tritici ST99CH_3D1]|nr:unnamed protein product [Zymoseptoria tritici ST99CH_3D1]